MSLKTRLDGRSADNSSFQVRNSEGHVVAEVRLLDSSGATLEISTQEGLHISKPSGWSSKTNKQE